MSALKFQVYGLPGLKRGAVVRPVGAIDGSSSTELRAQLEELQYRSIAFYLIDCAQISTINSTGFGVLVNFADVVNKDGGAMALCRPTKQVKMLVGMLGLEEHLRVSDNPQDAIALLQKAANRTGEFDAEFAKAQLAQAEPGFDITDAIPLDTVPRDQPQDEVLAAPISEAPLASANPKPKTKVAARPRTSSTPKRAAPPTLEPEIAEPLSMPSTPARGGGSVLTPMDGLKGRRTATTPPSATVHGYRRMRIGAHYCFELVLTPERLEGTAPTPILVIPTFAGCHVSPPLVPIDVAARAEKIAFWVTPIVAGRLPEPGIELWSNGIRLERLSIESRVSSWRLAATLSWLTALFPIAGALLGAVSRTATESMAAAEVFETPVRLVHQALPDMSSTIADGLAVGLSCAAVTLLGTVIAWFATRPRELKPEKQSVAAIERSA